MEFSFPSLKPRHSLGLQIRCAERDLLRRQRQYSLGTRHLLLRLRQQLTAPKTLLIAFGLGFIIGEMTDRQTCHAAGSSDHYPAVGTTRWQTAFSLAGSAHALYTALPVAWRLHLFRKARPTHQAHRKQTTLRGHTNQLGQG